MVYKVGEEVCISVRYVRNLIHWYKDINAPDSTCENSDLKKYYLLVKPLTIWKG